MNVEIAVPLTKEYLTALKKATAICFHFKNGRSFITCIIDNNARHNDIDVPCLTDSSVYGARDRDLGAIRFADHVISNTKYDASWQTAVDSLKEGDTLVLNWIANNSSELLVQANLFKDELRLIALRKVRGKEKRLTYTMSISVSANNSARMIRQERSVLSIIDREWGKA